MPLLLSFDKKVAFYTKWTFLFQALFIPAIFYIIWDAWFTKLKIWSFNDEYISGFHLFTLPVEEVLFFLIVPFCCVFIYECIRSYFPLVKRNNYSDMLMIVAGALLIITGIIFFEKLYTSLTFLFCGAGFLSVRLYKPLFRFFNSSAFFLSYLIILVPFCIVNGFLTAIPVVIYNDAENLGIRIYTIPVEDIFYGLLLMLLTISFYERFKQKAALSNNH